MSADCIEALRSSRRPGLPISQAKSLFSFMQMAGRRCLIMACARSSMLS
jgi:hypothetical protein